MQRTLQPYFQVADERRGRVEPNTCQPVNVMICCFNNSVNGVPSIRCCYGSCDAFVAFVFVLTTAMT